MWTPTHKHEMRKYCFSTNKIGHPPLSHTPYVCCHPPHLVYNIRKIA